MSPRIWPIGAADAYERLVDRLLASPGYGERWARHWLDLVRYAETAGHEFDYDIVNAFRYRDYVIRAFNADLPFHRFVTEQIAGDLLESPRRHPADGFNESILGTAFYFLGEGTHSPVDVREEQMRRIDNQIDVISKTFLGLTVACARCHDHKFDPITTKDYYALAGFLRSSRHQQALIDRPERIARQIERLHELKKTIAGCTGGGVGASLGRRSPRRGRRRRRRAGADEVVFDDFDRDSFDGWFVSGDAFGGRPSQPGDLRLDLADGASRLVQVKPGQAHSGVISDRLSGVLRSRSFTIEARYIHWLVAGRGGRINVRCRRLREDSRPDLRGFDAENRSSATSRAGSRRTWECGWAIRHISRSAMAAPSTSTGRMHEATTASARSPSTRSGCRISAAPAGPDHRSPGRARTGHGQCRPQKGRAYAGSPVGWRRRSTRLARSRPGFAEPTHGRWRSPTERPRTSMSTFEAATRTWVSSFRGGSSRSWAARTRPLTTRGAAGSSWRGG